LSNSEHNSNGERGVEHQAVDTLVLTYNRATDHLDVGGKFASIDLALDMLGRARRALEFQQRKMQAIEIQLAAQQALRDAAVADAVRNRR
jgi:hypothetical protein